MEFLNAFLVKVSRHKLDSSLTRVFVCGFLPSVFRSMRCYSWIDSSFLVLPIFWTAFGTGFLDITRVFSDSNICLVFYPLFPLYKMIFMTWTDFFFRRFTSRIFKIREEYGIFLIRQYKRLWIAWSKILESFFKFDVHEFYLWSE
jgi:hypothetical protein